MARQTFPYIGIPIPPTAPFPNGQVAYRPWLIALLRASNGNVLRCIVLPDSGADQCVFPLSFAIAMQLDPLQLKQQLTGGVGNTGNITYYDHLTVAIEGGPTFTAYAGFTEGLQAQGIGLLGQSGFFEKHVVTFDHAAREFHIDTLERPPQPTAQATP